MVRRHVNLTSSGLCVEGIDSVRYGKSYQPSGVCQRIERSKDRVEIIEVFKNLMCANQSVICWWQIPKVSIDRIYS